MRNPDTGMNLQTAAKLLPTPSAGNFNDGEDVEGWLARREALKAKGVNGNGCGTPLGIAVRLLPTPRTEGFDAGCHRGQPDSLHAWSKKLLPTPTVPNGGRVNPQGTTETGKRPDGKKAQMDLRDYMQKQGLATGQGSLSPEFVGALMGFPEHWAVLSPEGQKKLKAARKAKAVAARKATKNSSTNSDTAHLNAPEELIP